MKYLRRITRKNFLFLITADIILITISFYLSIIFRFDFRISNDILTLLNYQNILLLVFVKIFCFRLFSLYRGMWRYTSVWDMINIIKATSLSSFLLVFIVIFTIDFEVISRSVFIIDYIICTGFICTSRLGIRMFFSHAISVLRTNNIQIIRKDIILIGAGDTGQNIIRQTLQKSSSPIRVVGLIDDNQDKIGSEVHGVPVIATTAGLNDLKVFFDEIYICVPSANRKQMRRIVEKCKKTKKPFKTLPSISELMEGKVSISQFREVSLVDLLGRKEVKLDKRAINSFIKGKRVLVTGAGGSIGSELVRQCIKFEPSVLVMMDISELNLFEIDREILADDSHILFKPVLSDIRDNSVVDQVFDEFKPQIVFHAAAYKHVPMQEYFPWEAVKTNIFGTSNVSKI